MTKENTHLEETYLYQELGRLEKDLSQAAQWQYSFISIVIYDTALNGSKAISLLEDRLIRIGQKVAHIAPDERGQNTIEAELAYNKAWDETVFFMMHVSFNAEEAIYKTISERNDFIINNRIRVVYWITEDDFSTYISQMPDNWLFEHRFYALADAINWESIWSQIGTRTWKNLKERKSILKISENTPFEELLSLDIRDDLQGLIIRANLLVNLSLFYLNQQEYSKASTFAQKSFELAQFLNNDAFLAKTSLVMLLQEIRTGKKTLSIQIQKKNINSLDRRSSTWVLLGAIYTSLFMLDDAVIAYQNAIDLDHYNPCAFQGLGNVLIQQQNFNQAIVHFQKALDIQQNFSAAWQGLGKAYKAVENYAKALECYQYSVEINCFAPDIWLEISEISENETALLAAQRAVTLNPESAASWNTLGNIQYQMRKYNEAIRSYYRVTSIEKDFGWAYTNMALIHEQAHQYDKAILLLTKSIHVFQNDFEKAYAHYRLGQAYQQQEKYPAAAQAYRQSKNLFENSNLLEHYVTSPGPLKLQADLPKDNKEKKQKHNFSKAVVRRTKTKENISLAKVLPQKQKKSYTKTLKKALETNQKAHSVTYWLELGDFYIQNRMYDLAEETYRVALELEPDNGWTYHNLGRANMLAGLYDQAIPLYEKSIELFSSPQDKALSWNQLANAYRRLNEYPLAVAAHERARILEPVKNSMLARARASLLSNCYAH